MRRNEKNLPAIGLVGLGRMGSNLALNMQDHNVNVIVYNRTPSRTKALTQYGIHGAYTLEELVSKLDSKKVVWLMIPAGKIVDEIIGRLIPMLNEGDIVIDGGNSNYQDTLRRYEALKQRGVHFIDVGTSGGTLGARNGACMMVGGDLEAVEYVEPIFAAICVKDGYQYLGRAGAGHFVKMVHNGIEYGMMQAIGEGFEILETSPYALDLEKVARVWNNGSIIQGYLMEVTEKAFRESPKLDDIRGIVDSSGEGLWTVQEALALGVPAPVITQSLFVRYRSKQDDTFSGKVVAAQRKQFGGHAVHKKENL